MSELDSCPVEAVCTALADEECRRILRVLDEPLTASDVAQHCDLPQTSTYRKLGMLSTADLVEERTEIRDDGNHTTRFVRNATGAFVTFEDGQSFSVELITDDETPDQRLAQLWTQVSEEL
ncbi:helix-turn-helix domain-containing protein [Haloferax larsenii]|uniref:Helix-turn-helix domain-containing protein n=1 Tax=Haloferax larsenii TaxID=302484 RepID=A0ABY5RBB7_HALLR|nr:helix-turn-helix domain-containing protein [Haloferax larsenii]UVE49474.1 helix-turn-helix domain-containing protein [Haloferax larsenii]